MKKDLKYGIISLSLKGSEKYMKKLNAVKRALKKGFVLNEKDESDKLNYGDVPDTYDGIFTGMWQHGGRKYRHGN